MINDQFHRISEEYGAISSKRFEASAATRIITVDIPHDIREKLYLGDNYKVYGSCGQGRWAEIIWVAILDRRISTTTQKGYYIVYLLSPVKAELYLSLTLGWTQFRKEFGDKLGKEKIFAASSQLSSDLRNIPEGFKPGPIDLGAVGVRAKGYELGQVISKQYKINSLPDEKDMLNDLRSLLGTYEELVGMAGSNIMSILRSKPESTTTEVERIVAKASLQKDVAKSLKDLIDIAEAKPPAIRERFVKTICRNPTYANFVKGRAKYICEICSRKPFMQKNGKSFAEADHKTPLGGRGVDHPDNMRCLCAQCHAIVTHGSETEIVKLLGGAKA